MTARLPRHAVETMLPCTDPSRPCREAQTGYKCYAGRQESGGEQLGSRRGSFSFVVGREMKPRVLDSFALVPGNLRPLPGVSPALASSGSPRFRRRRVLLSPFQWAGAGAPLGSSRNGSSRKAFASHSMRPDCPVWPASPCWDRNCETSMGAVASSLLSFGDQGWWP